MLHLNLLMYHQVLHYCPFTSYMDLNPCESYALLSRIAPPAPVPHPSHLLMLISAGVMIHHHHLMLQLGQTFFYVCKFNISNFNVHLKNTFSKYSLFRIMFGGILTSPSMSVNSSFSFVDICSKLQTLLTSSFPVLDKKMMSFLNELLL